MHEGLVILIEVRQAQCQSLANWLGPGLSCGVNEEEYRPLTQAHPLLRWGGWAGLWHMIACLKQHR